MFIFSNYAMHNIIQKKDEGASNHSHKIHAFIMHSQQETYTHEKNVKR